MTQDASTLIMSPEVLRTIAKLVTSPTEPHAGDDIREIADMLEAEGVVEILHAARFTIYRRPNE